MNKYEDKITSNGVFRYKTSEKEQAFQYIVLHLLNWWKEANPDKDINDNDLGRLKISKLLFFVVAISSDRDNDGLLKVFNNWIARPYGHFEGDIDELIKHKNGEFELFTITQMKTILRNPDSLNIFKQI